MGVCACLIDTKQKESSGTFVFHVSRFSLFFPIGGFF